MNSNIMDHLPRRATIEIAKKLSISEPTVKSVINGDGSVSDETRLLVLAECHEMLKQHAANVKSSADNTAKFKAMKSKHDDLQREMAEELASLQIGR